MIHSEIDEGPGNTANNCNHDVPCTDVIKCRDKKESFEMTVKDSEISHRYTLLTTNLSKLNQGKGTTHDFLCAVFFYTRLCHARNIDPFSLSDVQQSELVDGLIQALPTMDKNLRRLVRRFGDECVDEGRFTKSGYQYLRDDFPQKMDPSSKKHEILKKGLNDFAAGENFKEISEVINNYKNDGGPSKNVDDPVLDLRGVPETHAWYTDYEREQSKRVYEVRQIGNLMSELPDQNERMRQYGVMCYTGKGITAFEAFYNAEIDERFPDLNRINQMIREMDVSAVFNTFGETNSEIHFSNGETTELMINNNIRLHPRTMAQLMTAERTVDGHTVLHKYCDATQRLDAAIQGFEIKRTLTPVERNANILASKDAFIKNISAQTKVDRFYTEPQIQKVQRTMNALVDEGDRNMFNNLSPAQAFRLNTVINNDIAGDQKRHVVAAAIALHKKCHWNNVEDIYRFADIVEIVKLSVRGSNLDGTDGPDRTRGERAAFAQQLANRKSKEFRKLVRLTKKGIARCNAVAGNQELPLGEGVGPFYHVDKHVVEEYGYFGAEIDNFNRSYKTKVDFYKNHLVAYLSNQIARERNEGVFDPQPGERQWTKGTSVYSQDGQNLNTTYSLALEEVGRTLNCYTSQPVGCKGNIGKRKMNSVYNSINRPEG